MLLFKNVYRKEICRYFCIKVNEMILTAIPERVNTKIIISKTILAMNIPFKLSDLYAKLATQGIQDHALILDVLNELYENGLVDYSSVEDDTFEFCIKIGL